MIGSFVCVDMGKLAVFVIHKYGLTGSYLEETFSLPTGCMNL